MWGWWSLVNTLRRFWPEMVRNSCSRLCVRNKRILYLAQLMEQLCKVSYMARSQHCTCDFRLFSPDYLGHYIGTTWKPQIHSFEHLLYTRAIDNGVSEVSGWSKTWCYPRPWEQTTSVTCIYPYLSIEQVQLFPRKPAHRQHYTTTIYITHWDLPGLNVL